MMLLPFLFAAASAEVSPGRLSTSLDGEWQFKLVQPGSAGTQIGTIQVPGSWEAQGFGNETVEMRTQVLTGVRAATRGAGALGIYTKKVALPACDGGSTAVFMVDQGIHRHAIFKIAGKTVGEHTGYLTPFEHALDHATMEDCCCGSSCEIEVALDGDRPCDKGGCPDALMGAADEDTDGTNLGGWAGLNGHVSVQCRPKVFIDGGIGNIIPPHVTHPPVTTASAGKPLELTVAFTISGGAATAHLQILDNTSGTPVPVAAVSSTAPQTGNATLMVTIPTVKLWSPEQRALYTAVVSIGGSGIAAAATVTDSATTRFGVRSVTVSGPKLLLNGQRVFLAGYGDDSIYPMTVSPPRDKAVYAAKVQFAHEHGFNFVVSVIRSSSPSLLSFLSV